MEFYQLEATRMNGKKVSMSEYKGKVIVVVNTASKCGFTPQLEGLEKLYEKYKDNGLVILGFPCNQFLKQDPANNEEIHSFCQLNYGVTFDMFEKIEVNGPNTHPVYQFLKKEAKGMMGEKIKWNFTKFLLDTNGNVRKRYAPTVKPEDMEQDIVSLLS